MNALGDKKGKDIGRVLGVDLQEVEPIPGAELHQLDFMSDGADDKVKEWLKGVDTTAGADVSEIKGFASSAGVVEGPARVLKRLKDIVDLQPGEVLVCPSTNPSWAPVFTNIKAAVTDIGGLTSHAAIVCREYGVPSVTGCGIATAAIQTGDIVKVDGDTGVVTVVHKAG